jgi:hypothetical protein
MYISQDRTVLATRRDGFICDGAEHGLFVHETRLLSRYRYLIDDRLPQPVALSNVEQHTWLGYYFRKRRRGDSVTVRWAFRTPFRDSLTNCPRQWCQQKLN